jgi:diadenosine tetraphosphate (Ap4A) HIT family hydrolase
MTTAGGSDRKWIIDEKWRDAITGRACEFCKAVVADDSEHGFKVADLRVSRWMLGSNQYIRGYSILILNFHSVEIFQLNDEHRKQFIDDIADASFALNEVLSPIKINLEMQGNVVPHLHCHIKPRFVTDRPGHARIFQDQQRIICENSEYESLAQQLRRHLKT